MNAFNVINQISTQKITTGEAGDKLLWAFAIDATKPLRTIKNRHKRATQPKYKLHRYVVTSCSPRLRQYGVKVGMPYKDAKALVPDMRIFVYNR